EYLVVNRFAAGTGTKSVYVDFTPDVGGMTFDNADNLWVATVFGNSVTEYDVSGKPFHGYSFGPQGTSAQDVAFDREGNLFVNTINLISNKGTIYKRTPSGVITTFASDVGGFGPLAIDDSDNLYCSGIYRIAPDGTKSLFA